jgi:SAM-dependent methyltransferase
VVTGPEDWDYLLGDSAVEARRLELQAALWDPVSHALFDRLGVARGWRVLEVGPGVGSLHLELRRRVEGAVDIVEQSAAFAATLSERCTRDGFGPGRVWNQPLIDADLPADHYDLIFARWVFLFLPDPAAHLAKLAAALTPGGAIAIQDYFRDTFGLVPRPPDWEALVAADRAFFASQGGDANIGARVPGLFDAAGLDVVDIMATTKTGHPGSPVWEWLTTYFLGVLEPYSAFAPFTPEAARRIDTAWRQAGTDAASLLIAPTVLGVVGRKRA